MVVSTRFTWDEAKALANRRKHGVTFEEAIPAVLDPARIEIPDPDFDDRTRILGRSTLNVLFVVVLDEAATTRIISAREANKREQEAYYNRRR